jgi:hypothetical protein
MREFGKLLKDLFSPKKSTHFWIRVTKEFHTREEREEFIYATLELLDNETKVKA